MVVVVAELGLLGGALLVVEIKGMTSLFKAFLSLLWLVT